MPLYQFRCPDCSFLTKRILNFKGADHQFFVQCKKCNNTLVFKDREFADTSSNSKEIIDNGIMPRKVENFANSNELMQDRNHVALTRRKKNEL